MIQASTQRRKRSSQQSVTPQFLLRVGGLPIDALDALQFSRTVERIEQILSCEKALAEQKDALIDALYAEVSIHKENRDLRRKLINLKRDIFNQKVPDELDELRNLAGLLSAPTSELLLAWLDVWEHHQALFADAPRIFTQEMDRKRTALKAMIDTPDFRRGIALASPVLAREVDAYLKASNQHLKRNARTVERSLTEYLLRTTCKTSPFSTFTAVAVGSFVSPAEANAPDITYQADSMEQHSTTSLNVAVLYKLSDALLHSTIVREQLFVRLTPGWQIQDGYIRYARRIGLDTGEDNGPLALRSVHEDMLYLPLGRLLAALLAALDHGQTLRLKELSEILCAIPEYANADEEIDHYLDRLLQLGLLVVPDLQLDLQHEHLLASYCQGLRQLKLAETDAIAENLQQIETLVEAYATAAHTQRQILMNEVEQLVSNCFALLGNTEVAVPSTLIYEDTILTPTQLVANKSAWQNLLSQMGELQPILPVFDLNLEKKIVTQGYFRARYGEGHRHDDFLAFIDDFRQNFFEQYRQGSRASFGQGSRANHFHQAELERLHQVQQAVTDYMCQLTARQTQNTEVVLDEDFIQTLLPYVPEYMPTLASSAFFAQFVREGGEPLVVINHIYSGFTQQFSRFAHLFREENGEQVLPLLKANLQRITPPGAVFAELKGGYDATNLNIHLPVTAYELVCPGEKSSRPPDEQIPLEDLVIVDDGYLHLYSKRLEKEVIPLYLGFLLPMMLPEIHQVILAFSHASLCALDLWKGVKAREDDRPIFYPRLCYKNLVLQRAHWELPATLLPQRESGQDDFTFFVRLNRWRKAQGLPRRLFVSPEQIFGEAKAQSQSEQPAKENDASQQMRDYKPFYLDFENFFTVTLLESLARTSTQTLVFTEMLPEQSQLWLKQQQHAYVSEFVLEINTTEGETDV